MKTNILNKLKEHLILITLTAFAMITLAVILIATLAMKEFVVPVCVLVIIEAAIASLLRKSEIWLHGVVLVVQLVAGAVIGRFPLTALCVVIYITATLALMFISKKENET